MPYFPAHTNCYCIRETLNEDKGICLPKIHDNVLLYRLSNENEHDSPYVSKN